MSTSPRAPGAAAPGRSRSRIGHQGGRKRTEDGGGRRVRGRGVGVAAVVLLAVAGCGDDHVGGWSSFPTSSPSTAETTVPPADPGTTLPATASPTTASPATSLPATTAPETSAPATTAPGDGDGDGAADELPPLLTNADGSNDAFSGVGQLDGLGASCTAFLLDVGPLDGPALALTNGHCVGLFDSTTVIVDGPGDGGVVSFRHFVDTDPVEVGVASVRWATMRGVDVAVLELDGTLGALHDQGIQGSAIAGAATEGSSLHVVGVPVNDVPADQRFLRRVDCTALGTSRVVEFTWVWDAVQANDCTPILGGNSGSPLFDESGAVVGIINTTTYAAPGGGACYLGRPCEITSAGVHQEADRSYAILLAPLLGCFTATGFDRQACAIETGVPFAQVTNADPYQQRPAAWAATIDLVPDQGGAGAQQPAPLVAKAGPLATTDCRAPEGYGDLPGQGRLSVAYDAAVPDEEGISILCVAAADGSSGGPDTRSAGFALLEVDDTPPVLTPELISSTFDGGYSVEPRFDTPELSDFSLKFGPTADVDCDDPSGYLPYRRIPVRVPATDLPAAVCVIGADVADNTTPPVRTELPVPA